MNEPLDFETWDVFTDRRFAGNPLAVVFDADPLSAAAMLAITREFDYSESVFVLPAASGDAAARIRIFTPGGEIPFAGHPTVGAACAIARRAGRDGSDPEATVLELAAGRFPVRVGPGPAGWFAEFENPNPPRVDSPGPDAARIEAALGLPEGSVARDPGPVRAGAGIDFIYARAPLDAVRSARLDPAAWRDLGIEQAEGPLCGVYLYAAGGDDSDFHARMFGPHIGVAEDPATGSAAAGLPAHLLASHELPDGDHRLVIEQGIEMGRPSRIRLHVSAGSDGVTSVRIGGMAVPVMRGALERSD